MNAAAAANPYLGAATEGLGIITDIIGMIMQKQAWDEAKAEAKRLDYRNFEYGKERDAVSDRQWNEGLKLNKRVQSLNEQKFGLDSMLSKFGVTQSNIQQVGDMLNKNTALKNRVLQTWSM